MTLATDFKLRTAKYSLKNGHTWPDRLGTVEFMREVERATTDVVDKSISLNTAWSAFLMGALQLGASLYLAKLQNEGPGFARGVGWRQCPWSARR